MHRNVTAKRNRSAALHRLSVRVDRRCRCCLRADVAVAAPESERRITRGRETEPVR